MIVTAMANATVTITIIDTRTQHVFFMDARLQPPLQSRAALHHTAIRDDGGRRDIAGPIAGQEGHYAGDLFRLRHPAEWNRTIQLQHERRIRHGGKIDRRRDRTGSYAYDQDVMGSELHSCRARQHAHTAFGKTIRCVAGHWPVFMDRRDVDDTTTAALLDHLFRRQLGAKKRALQVDFQYLLVLRFRGVEDRRAWSYPRIIHHDVNMPPFIDRSGHQTLQVSQFADVRLNPDNAFSQTSDLRFEGVGRLGMRDVVDNNACSLYGELGHNRFADTAIAASDDGNFLRE